MTSGPQIILKLGPITLKAARICLGHTQQEAAKICGVAHGTYKTWEQGRRPALRHLAAVRSYIATAVQARSPLKAYEMWLKEGATGK